MKQILKKAVLVFICLYNIFCSLPFYTLAMSSGTPITPGTPIKPGDPITPGTPIISGDPATPGSPSNDGKLDGTTERDPNKTIEQTQPEGKNTNYNKKCSDKTIDPNEYDYDPYREAVGFYEGIKFAVNDGIGQQVNLVTEMIDPAHEISS